MTTVTVPAREHREGCPATRAEEFTITPPEGPPVRVLRCIDCGGQVVLGQPEGEDDADE